MADHILGPDNSPGMAMTRGGMPSNISAVTEISEGRNKGLKLEFPSQTGLTVVTIVRVS